MHNLVPMVSTLGLEYADDITPESAVVVLRDQPAYRNHVGGPHAAAMFLVGGGILMHGMPGGHGITHAVEAVAGPLAVVATSLADMLLGILAGALALGAMKLVDLARGKGAH